jgi:hypothetical protein
VLQQRVVDRHRVDSGRLHRDMGDAERDEPPRRLGQHPVERCRAKAYRRQRATCAPAVLIRRERARPGHRNLLVSMALATGCASGRWRSRQGRNGSGRGGVGPLSWLANYVCMRSSERVGLLVESRASDQYQFGRQAHGWYLLHSCPSPRGCLRVSSRRDVGSYRPSTVAVQLAVWTLSLAVRIRMGVGCRPVRRCLPSAEGRARHTRPRGSEESGNVQVRRMETAGNRRFSSSLVDPGNRQTRSEYTRA